MSLPVAPSGTPVLARTGHHLPAPAVVLDTNAVLDWLVFGNPACVGWSRLFIDGSVRWLASKAMRDELENVLQRSMARSWNVNLPALWAHWMRWSVPTEAVSLSGAAGRMRCTDADDQMFIDLALGHGARWLISRDRAVLKLARRARPLGLSMSTPDNWHPPTHF